MPRGFKNENYREYIQWKPTALLRKTTLASFPSFLLDVFYKHTDKDGHLCTQMNTFLRCCVFFSLKANKEMFDVLLCSPTVILESSRYDRPPMFFSQQHTHVFTRMGVISSLWRNTEVVSPLSCFLFHFYRMKGNNVNLGVPTLENFLSVPPSRPLLLHGEWILYLWCQWLEPQRTEGDYPSVKSYKLLPRWRSSHLYWQENNIKTPDMVTGSWSKGEDYTMDSQII